MRKQLPDSRRGSRNEAWLLPGTTGLKFIEAGVRGYPTEVVAKQPLPRSEAQHALRPIGQAHLSPIHRRSALVGGGIRVREAGPPDHLLGQRTEAERQEKPAQHSVGDPAAQLERLRGLRARS